MFRIRKACCALVLSSAAIMAIPSAAAAQVTPSPGADLARHLNTLAQNPTSLSALMGAGRASLEVGDPQAALNFFGRAEEQAPRDGRIKMWIGSALVQAEQPMAALRMFSEARALGVAEADLAGDRGLAYDLNGDQVSAQRDYALALRKGADAEVTRRLALSLAISGKREAALALLEDQLLRRDRAAERTRTLILAVTGDVSRANQTASASLPPVQAALMAPFFARLASLDAADRAAAVHFGRLPGDGSTRLAQADASRVSGSNALATQAGRPDTRTSLASRTPSPPPPSTAPRRRPGSEEDATPTILARNDAVPVPVPTPRPVPPPSPPPPVPTPSPPPPAPSPIPAPPPPAPSPSPAPAPSSSFADVAALVAALPETEMTRSSPPPPPPARVSPPPPSPRSATATRTARASPPPPPPPPREAARHWVQVAGGANRATLPREFARLKAKAPAVFGSRAAWAARAGATNRLLVGPFRNEGEAQEFVNALAGKDVAAFAWTSAAGQAVERLPAR